MFKKILSIITLSFLIFTPVMGAETLWEYYTNKGLELPSLDVRSEVYTKMGFYDDYLGTSYQNTLLLEKLKEQEDYFSNDIILGAVGGSSELPNILADFDSSLVSRIDENDLSMSLVDSQDDDGNTLSGWYGFTIDANSSSKEYIIGNCTGSSCTNLLRGVSFSNGISTSSARSFIHRRGADVSITDHPNITIITNILNGNDGVPDKLYYDNTISISAGDNGNTLITKTFAESLTNSGVATSTQIIFGGGKEATQDQMSNQYYNIDDPRFITTRYASSSRDIATTTAVITDPDGYINQNRLDLSEDFPFTGENSFTGTTTLATTTISGKATFTGEVIGAGFTNVEVFTSNGTWTKPSGILKARIRVIGGGGNGGDGDTTPTGMTGGGGGGGYCEEIIDVSATSSVNVIVGTAGLLSSFGDFCTANGGADGGNLGSYVTNGGGGGTATGGDVNIKGMQGLTGIQMATGGSVGQGGNSLLGTGGASFYANSPGTCSNGNPGNAYGGGGSGCRDEDNTCTCTGGAGASGIVIVEY